MKVVTYSHARNSLKSVLDGVVQDADVTIISRRDAEGDAVVMSLDSNSIMETLHLTSNPVNAAALARARGLGGQRPTACRIAGRISQSPVCFACFDTRLNKAAKVPEMAALLHNAGFSEAAAIAAASFPWSHRISWRHEPRCFPSGCNPRYPLPR